MSTKPEPLPQPGDLVRLKSGGPLMTFVRLTEAKSGESPEAFCVWFPGDMAQTGTFPVSTLENSRH